MTEPSNSTLAFTVGGPEIPSIFLRKNDLAFRIILFFSGLAVPYTLIFYKLQWYFSTAMVLWTLLLYLISIGLHRFHHYSFSKAILIVGTAISFFVCANILGPGAGAQLLLFALIPLPLLLFDYHQFKWILFCISVPITAYLGLELGQYQWIPFREIVTETTLFYIRCSAIITTFLMLILSVGAYFVSNRQYEVQLESKNSELNASFKTEQALRIESENQAQQLQASNVLLHSLTQKAALGAIIRGIVHEVKSPLTSIRACCSLILLDASLSQSSRESIENIRNHVHHLTELIRTLLADSGSIVWMDVPMDIGRIVDQAVRLVENEGFIRKIKLVSVIPDGLPMIKGTTAYISQALLNLLVNALQFSPDNSEITVRVHHDPKWITIDVHDCGPGIPKELQGSVFLQGITSNTPAHINVGLGLYFVKRVMDAHHGVVSILDTSGQGTIMRLQLPIKLQALTA